VADELEIIGPASRWLTARIRTFCAELGGPWGEVPAGRLVIATDFAGALRRYLPADRYRAWERRQQDRAGHGTGVGMGFVAPDAVPTAVVAALPEATNRGDLLAVCCHELCELSIGDTGARGHDTLRAVMSGIVWSEHVVERRRAEVFLRHRWPKGVFGCGFLKQSWNDYRTEYPALLAWAVQNDAVPDRLFGLWQFITREVVCAYGHAQAGDSAEERRIEAFLDLQREEEAKPWLDLMLVCDRAYESPELDHDELDVLGEEGWVTVYEALAAGWDNDFLAAQRGP
jgi:hypothetical protein